MANSIPGGMESSGSEDEMDMIYFPGNKTNKLVKKLGGGDGATNSQLPSEPVPIQSNGIQHASKSAPKIFLASDTVALDDFRLAVTERRIELLEPMLLQGIQVDCVLKSGWTALMYACAQGFPEIVEFLISKGANVNFAKSNFTPLMALCSSKKNCEKDQLECCLKLIEKGAKINLWDRHHMTALIFAARENHVDIIKELIKNEVDLDKSDNKGWTALCWAAHRGHGQALRLFLEAGASVSPTQSGDSAIEIAFAAGHDNLGNALTKFKRDKLLDESELESVEAKQEGEDFDLINAQYTTSSSYDEMDMFLVGLNLRELIPLFREQGIDFKDFTLLTDAELINMGVTKIGDRKRILEGIKIVHTRKWEKSSLPNLKQKNFISCPDAVRTMANISNHMRHIKSSVKYLNKQIELEPKTLEYGQELANVLKLIEETSLSLRVCAQLKDDISDFELYLNKIKDNVELLPADMIRNNPNAPKYKYGRVVTSISIGALFVGICLVWKRPEWIFKSN